jgi:metal-responsive CopG/Arc/MetJ family transcriptional regulator
MSENKMVPISIRLSEPLLKRFKHILVDESLGMSEVIRLLIEDYVERKETDKQNGNVEEDKTNSQ